MSPGSFFTNSASITLCRIWFLTIQPLNYNYILSWLSVSNFVQIKKLKDYVYMYTQRERERERERRHFELKIEKIKKYC